MEIASRTRLVTGLLMLAVLAALGVLGVNAVSPLAPAGAEAPADEFSASRAFTHVQRVGLQIHPAGSAAAADVRDYIVDTLAGLGLVPQVREGIGATSELGGQFAMADTRSHQAGRGGVPDPAQQHRLHPVPGRRAVHRDELGVHRRVRDLARAGGHCAVDGPGQPATRG